ncbi:MAG: metallophosphoesterase, partial [Methanobrevibacter sp.]|nr:metallophosphoesterase [Methanobrevibacter sp.]
MKEHNDEVPQAMRIRQEIQESMNNSLPEKKFRKEKIDVVEIDIELDNLGWDFHNYRILNLTDIHLGQWVTPEYLDELIDYVNTLNYDVATLTGDYISYIIDGYEDCLKDSFKKLKSNDGKFGVLGNHDHWMGAD